MIDVPPDDGALGGVGRNVRRARKLAAGLTQAALRSGCTSR
jgi:hypothetical protein